MRRRREPGSGLERREDRQLDKGRASFVRGSISRKFPAPVERGN